MLRFSNNPTGRKLTDLRNSLNLRALATILLLSIFFVAYTPQSSASNGIASQSLAALAGTVRFAAISDYGAANANELAVANLIKSWNPDFIITLGDNNYPDGAASTIDSRIGQYFHDYIYPYTGSYTPGSASNRFFPALGNHDWVTAGALPYLNYFSLPNNERYYTFIQGPVEFFVMDSDSHEPDGISVQSVQAAWLRQQLAASSAIWKIVYFHHPPYSSGSTHGSTTALQWPFQQWGASAVLSGHEHNYERIILNGFPYIVNGLGGDSLYGFGTPITGSQIRYNTTYGAQLIDASADHITFQFYSIANGGTLIDSYTINTAGATATPAVTNTTTPNQTPTATISNNTPTKTLTPTPVPTVTKTLTVTPTPISGNTLTLNAVADSYISDNSPSSNFGISTTLRTDGSPIQRSYLRFDVPQLSGSVVSAALRVYANTSVSIGYTVHVTTATWNETTINFNNAPAFGNGIGNSGAIASNSWTQVDVTSVITGTGQYSFVLDTTNSTATSLSSREGANPPQLIISMGSSSSPTSTSTATNTPTTTSTVGATLTKTAIPTNTPTITATRLMTATPTLTAIPTKTATPTLTAIPTNTPTITATRLMTATPTLMAIPTKTATPTSTPTIDPCLPPFGSGGKPRQCK